jgi:UDP-2,3-diacylglucosamine pyrophosphatase LpxH
VHWIAGDGHFVGAAGEAERWRALVERVAQAGVREVSLLGDLFELWIGLDGLETEWQRAIFDPLFALKARGVRLRYVVGNKDYFIREWNARRRLFDDVVDDRAEVAGLHLAHGDLVNVRDRQYRLWRSFSRSWLMRMLMTAWPRRHLAKIAARVAERMKGTNLYHKSYFPEAELRARAKELPAGKATLVYGHFHVHRVIEEGDKRIVTLPFLGGEWQGVLVGDDGAVTVL